MSSLIVRSNEMNGEIRLMVEVFNKSKITTLLRFFIGCISTFREASIFFHPSYIVH